MRGFLDTNVLVDAFTTDQRAEKSRALIDGHNRIAVPSLNEFALVARRRLRMTWDGVHEALDRLRRICPKPKPLTLKVHATGLGLTERYQLRIFDAMIVAAALVASGDTLWFENMHDGLIIADRLTIRNWFA
jgi:predicted nucleic acid-binding protein